jgi:hypothetical protein
VSELFSHLFSSLLVERLQDRSILLNLEKRSSHREVYPGHLKRASGNKGSALGCSLFRNVFMLLLFAI